MATSRYCLGEWSSVVRRSAKKASNLLTGYFSGDQAVEGFDLTSGILPYQKIAAKQFRFCLLFFWDQLFIFLDGTIVQAGFDDPMPQLREFGCAVLLQLTFEKVEKYLRAFVVSFRSHLILPVGFQEA